MKKKKHVLKLGKPFWFLKEKKLEKNKKAQIS